MFKHVNKFTRELRNFDSKEYDAAGLTEASAARAKTKKVKRRYKGKKPQQIEEEYEEKEVHNCRLCQEDEIEDLEKHCAGVEHKRNLIAFKTRYVQFIKMAKDLILNAKLPRGKGLRKLRYFKALYNYE